MIEHTLVLLGGSALIMFGMFGLIEVAIRSRQVPVRTAVPLRRRATLPVEQAAVAEVEERHLELTVVRDREVNPDGRSRQEIISDLDVGDAVVLVPEPVADGRQDIRVVATAGTIGYVPDNRVIVLLEMIAACTTVRSEISYIGRVGDVCSAWVAVAARS